MNQQLGRLDLDRSAIASQVGISREHFNRLLRGEVAIRLPLMHRIAKAVALDIELTFKATE